MNRLSWINTFLGLVFGLLLWTTSPILAVATCNPNILATTPTSDFILNNDGTATHRKTGLMWMRCALGQNWDSTTNTCTGSPSTYHWDAALGAARGYSFADHNDWRLPNAKELATIVEDRCFDPGINETVFPRVSSYTYNWSWSWSSSTLAKYPDIAMVVLFYDGSVAPGNKSAYSHARLVRGGSSFGDYVRSKGGGVTETPEQPIYGDPPPVITVPSGVKKHLVLLIHGWNSAPACWADAMKESIKLQLPSYNGQEGCKDGQTIEDTSTNTSWQICTYNWSKEAGFGGSCSWLPEFIVTPWDAYSEASKIGKKLADDIISHSQSRSYDFIHFIAHSAGSQVAEKAAERLEERNVNSIIHTTFLDAFDPAGNGSAYGSHSDWAEHYVDMRRVFDVGLDDTDLTLPSAYNFDITALDLDGNNTTGTEAHAWPYKWYEGTIKNPTNSDYGFSLSLESGRDQLPSNFPKGGKCVFFSSISTVCSESGVLAGITSVRVVIDNVLDVFRAIPDATISATGSVLFLPSKIVKLITGSPAWVSLPIEVTEPIDTLNFDYVYQRQAEGLLSVFFDNQLVYRSDQRVELSGTNQSGNVPIGAIASGTHTLSFRLDAFNGTQSEIDISRIQLGKMEVSTSPVDATPPVITPTVTGTLGNNGWYTSDITVSWEVTDAESDVTFTNGCGTATVSTDTAGVTFTCSATSSGGTTSETVTVQRDATPPTIVGSASPAANANGWNNSSVTVSFTCNDATSGIATCTSPQTLNQGANQTASGTATDKAGNTASTEVTGINVDMTPPVIAGMPTTCTLWPPNRKMVQVATVTATDALSGVAPGSFSVTGASNEPFDPSDPDIVIQPNGSGSFTVQLRADRLGTGTGRIYTLTATATDQGGNAATSTSTCKVPHDQGKG